MSIFREDEKIVAGLQEGGGKRVLYEKQLYHRFVYFIDNAVRKHKITREDAGTAYHETIMAVISKVVDHQFEGRSSLETFASKIFYFKCVDIIRKTPTNIIDQPPEDLITILPGDIKSVIDSLMSKYNQRLIRQGLEDVGEKCKQMLLHYEDGYTDKEIAEMMGFNSGDVAKVSRLRCLQKLKERIGPIDHE